MKAEILKEVEKSLKGKVIREDVSTTLKEPREYWFVKRTVDGKRQDGLMRTVIDSVTSWRALQNIALKFQQIEEMNLHI